LQLWACFRTIVLRLTNFFTYNYTIFVYTWLIHVDSVLGDIILLSKRRHVVAESTHLNLDKLFFLHKIYKSVLNNPWLPFHLQVVKKLGDGLNFGLKRGNSHQL
jgi:hypothetical protein